MQSCLAFESIMSKIWNEIEKNQSLSRIPSIRQEKALGAAAHHTQHRTATTGRLLIYTANTFLSLQ